MSNNNLDSPANPNELYFNIEKLTPSVQNIDNSANLNASNNDIFGEKALKCRLPRKQKVEPNPENLVQDNLDQYVQDLTNANRYAPQDVLRSIEPSEDGKYFLVDPVKNPPTFRKSSLDFSPDPIDQIVVLTSPNRDIKPEDKLVGIYQQVSEEYTDGTSYTGEKYLGLRQGKGTYYYHDGYRYEGSWHEDKMSGFGILWVNDEIKWYEGEWKDNTFHGRGIIYNITPEELDPEANFSDDLSQVGNGWLKYEGKFHNGSKHGFGTLFLTNGDSFTGNFNFDNVEGRGSYAKPEKKRIIAGSWVKNVLKSSYRII